MASIRDMVIEEMYDTGGTTKRIVDITVVKTVREEKTTLIVMEVKTGMETIADPSQVKRDAQLAEIHKCTAYYYFDQAPSNSGMKNYLGFIRQIYTDGYWSEILKGKVFVVIGGRKPVEPTDKSLDAYIARA